MGVSRDRRAVGMNHADTRGESSDRGNDRFGVLRERRSSCFSPRVPQAHLTSPARPRDDHACAGPRSPPSILASLLTCWDSLATAHITTDVMPPNAAEGKMFYPLFIICQRTLEVFAGTNHHFQLRSLKSGNMSQPLVQVGW